MFFHPIHGLHLLLTLPSSKNRLGRRVGMFMVHGRLDHFATSASKNSSPVDSFSFLVSLSMTCAAPSYVIEIAPPQWHGKFTAFYSCESGPSIDR